MLAFVLRPLRQLAQALTANDSPRQVAWGVVLGMLVGLLPKGNLIALTLGMLLFGLRVNLSAGMLAGGLFSLLSIALDPTAHRIGTAVLLSETLRGPFTWLYHVWWGPLTGFNNTVVVGQLIIGCYLVYPMYLVGHWLGAAVQPRVSQYLLRYRAIRWLRGAELGANWGS